MRRSSCLWRCARMGGSTDSRSRSCAVPCRMGASRTPELERRREIAFGVTRATLWLLLVGTVAALLYTARTQPPPGVDLHFLSIRMAIGLLFPVAALIGLGLLW